VDPGGIVQSQVIRSPNNRLRIILNASQSRRTLAARFLTDFFGSGVQHIALATDDIFATVAEISARGIGLLPIPQNYYDDLEARTDLSEEQVGRMRAANILYDREGTGEFYQAYTTTLEGGFFFEIVQRTGYSGFGAANAPIRLAAQTRLAPGPDLPRS
jgi:4-hydroxyphenylpyruvate dioxygenase